MGTIEMLLYQRTAGGKGWTIRLRPVHHESEVQDYRDSMAFRNFQAIFHYPVKPNEKPEPA